MLFNNVGIKSFGYFLPDQGFTSGEIEDKIFPTYERLKMAPGRLELMTGIKERRFWDPGTSPSTLSLEAAKIALGNIPPEEIDLLIHASVCRDFLEPATASIVHQKLGLSPNFSFFDLSNACLGFLNAFVIAAHLIEFGKIKNALIVSGENSGPLLLETIKKINQNPNLTRREVKKLFANLTIGSAAVAFLLSQSNPEIPRLIGGSEMVDSSASNLCQGGGNIDSLMMETNTEELMEKGLALAASNWDKTQTFLGKPDWVITHQVGSVHEKALKKSLNLEHLKTFSTYPEFGNTGSAALPLTLIKLAETGRIKKGEIIALLGIGSGLSSLNLGVKW